MKLLAIDDKADLLASLAAMLRVYLPSCELATASSGEAGIEMAREFQPDAILLAIQMPGMDGFEVCRVLKADPATRDIPVIFLTAQDVAPASRIRGLEIGGEAFLTQPVEPGELMAQVRAMVRIKQAEDALRSEKSSLDLEVSQRTAALRESEERFRLLYEQAPIGYQSLDKEGNFLSVNETWLAMLGYSREEVVGRWFGDFLAPGYQDRFRADFARLKTAEEFLGDEFQMVRKDGSTCLVSFNLKIGKDEVGNFKQAHSVLSDITERKRAERLEHAIYEIARAPETAKTLNDLYRSVHQIIKGLMPAENFYVALYDEKEDLLSYPYFVDEIDVPDPPQKLGKDLTAYVLRTGSALLCDAALDEEMVCRGEVEMVGVPSSCWLGVPLKAGGKTIGAMVVQHYSDPKAYGEREAQVLDYVSGQVANAIERKRAEEALQASERRFALFMQNLPGVAVIRDLEGRYIYMNEAWERAMGLRREDYLGKSPLDSFPREDALRLLEDDQRLTESKEAQVTEMELHHASGPRWWLVNRFRLESEQGRPPYVAALYQDITERKRAGEALELSNRTQSILNGLMSLSLKNLDLEAMLQRALDHVLAIPWLELTPKGAIFLVEGGALALKAHKGMPEALLKSCATVGPNQCLCGRAMATGEFIFSGHLDGRHETTYEGIMPHGHYCVPIASGGEVKGVMCLYLKEGHEVRPGERELLEAVASVLAGIAQRKRAEEALRESEEKFRKAFDMGPDSININRLHDGVYVSVNQGFTQIMGYTEAEAIGHTSMELDIWDRPEDRMKMLEHLRRNGAVENFEARFRAQNGDIKQGLMSASLIDIDGTPHILSITRDITTRKRLEEALGAAKKLETIGMITGGVAHEVRNPLNSIQIMAAVLEKKQGNDPDLRQCVAHIQEQVQRLSMLMKDLLLLGRPADPAGFVPCNIRDLAISAAQISEAGTDSSAHRVLVQSDDPLPTVPGEAGKLTQVLVNLLQNALSLSPEGTPVEVNLSQVDAMVQIQVRDRGPGIAQDFLPRLFQPFQSKRKGGTGLGLAIVQKIVADHGGVITAANNDPGPGATFTVRLPVRE